MQQIDLNQINVDELFQLRDATVELINALDFAERSYCDGLEEFEAAMEDAAKDYLRLRSRIRGLAIEYGIHADFLREYSELERQSGLKISA